jgi:hypothetical protein
MRPATDLGKIYSAASYRILRIRRLFSLAKSPNEPRRSEYAAICVLELDNLIIGCLRVYTISTLRRGRTANGQRIATTRPFSHEEEVGAYILSILNHQAYQRLHNPQRIRKKDEPTIRDPRFTERVLLSCGASNVSSLQNALSINTNLFNDISTVRNFYAHRNADTWRKVRTKAHSMGIFGITHPNDLITSILPGRPISLFEDWLDDAELFFEEATK